MSLPPRPQREEQQAEAEERRPPLPPLSRPPLLPPPPPSPLGGPQPGMMPHQNIITGVDITKLIQYVFEEKQAEQQLEEDIERVRQQLEKLMAVARSFIDVYVRDGMSRIVHPAYGIDVIGVRFIEIAELIRSMLSRRWRELRKAIRDGADPHTVAKMARSTMQLTRYAIIALLEIYEKLVILLFVNAPAPLRPPLANIALGYELLHMSEEEVEERLLKRKRRKKTKTTIFRI